VRAGPNGVDRVLVDKGRRVMEIFFEYSGHFLWPFVESIKTEYRRQNHVEVKRKKEKGKNSQFLSESSYPSWFKPCLKKQSQFSEG